MLTVLSVALSSALVAAVCTVIFATVYKRELMRDARLSAEQSVGQAAAAVNNYLELMKKKLTIVSDTVNGCRTADDMEERISAITKIESDIYAVTVYDENGKIILRLYADLRENGDREVYKREMTEFVERNFSRFSVPREIVFMDRLPETPLMKIDFMKLTQKTPADPVFA
mgnify:CR=1 FL=1